MQLSFNIIYCEFKVEYGVKLRKLFPWDLRTLFLSSFDNSLFRASGGERRLVDFFACAD